jgi:two-component system sensor histidine kinase AgrC
MISLDYFVKEERWSELADYYHKRFKNIANFEVTKIIFDDLANIKILEIKSLIAVKLMEASLLDNVDIEFEAVDTINNIDMNVMDLIRILGIILDNAIEELATIGGGKLQMAIFTIDEKINIIVNNTCRKDMPSIKRLTERGFSTKGPNRGLGLSNLVDIEQRYRNLNWSYGVVDNTFEHKLIID